MNHLSLFAGIGGFDLACEKVGIETVGQVEIDPFCQRVLAARWPEVRRVDDVRHQYARREGAGSAIFQYSSGAWSRLEYARRIDLLVGGFPCQDLSVAGKRAGLAGERSGLFWEIVRIAKAITPRWGLFENVPGLLSSQGGRDFALVLAGLRECWPAVGYRILDSQFFGVAQRRRRVFFVCGPTERDVAQVLFEPEGGERDSQASGETGASVAASLVGGSVGTRSHNKPSGSDRRELVVTALQHLGSGGPDDNEAQHRRLVVAFQHNASTTQPLTLNEKAAALKGSPNSSPAIMGTLREHMRPGSNTDYCVTHPLSADGHDASEDGTGRGTPLVIDRIDGWIDREDRVFAYQSDKKRSTAQEHIYHKPAGLADSLTEQKQHVLTQTIRRLTPTECERLQGFPDFWTCICGVGDEYRKILRMVYEASLREDQTFGADQEIQARGLVDAVHTEVLQLALRQATPSQSDRLPPGFWEEASAQTVSYIGQILHGLRSNREDSARPSRLQPAEQPTGEHHLSLHSLPHQASLEGRASRPTESQDDSNIASRDFRLSAERSGCSDHGEPSSQFINALQDSPAERYWFTCKLPDELAFRCTCPDGPRYRALGNAVTVNTVVWILRRLVKVSANHGLKGQLRAGRGKERKGGE